MAKINKQKRNIVIFGILLLVVLIYSNLDTLSFVKNGQFRNYNIQQTSQTSDYYSYLLSSKYFDGATLNNADCNQLLEQDFGLSLIWNDNSLNYADTGNIDVEIPLDIQFNKYFFGDAQINNLGGVNNPCTDLANAVPVSLKNLTSQCIVDSKDQVTCQVNGVAYNQEGKALSLFGDPEVILSINLLKQGVNCLSGEEMCENTTYSLCENGNFTIKGEVNGKCGINMGNQTFPDCTNGEVRACTLSVASGTKECIGGQWTSCFPKSKGIPFYYYLGGLVLLSGIIYLFLRKKHGR